MTTIIGYELALAMGLARLLQEAVKTRHDYTDIRDEPRGASFRVQLREPDGQETGRVARVTIEIEES